MNVDPQQARPCDKGPGAVLERFGCSAGGRVVLDGIDLRVEAGGTMALLGPAGSGKSLLLRLLAGGTASPGVLHWGTMRLAWPAVFVPQRVRPRPAHPDDPATCGHLDAIADAMASDAALICLDEPTAGLDGFSRARVLQLIRRFRKNGALVYVTHNRRDAMTLGGDVALLAGGRIVERAEARAFFSNPSTDLGRCYVRTGSCPTSAAALPNDGVVGRRMSPGQRELPWVLPGRLVGCARPGLLADVEDDLARLRSAGVRWLVCLEETDPISAETRAQFGLRGYALPIVDMGAPEVANTEEVCRLIDKALAAGEGVAVHCRGGLGRTGTILAAYLCWSAGLDAVEAVARARLSEPGFVQSTVQLDFLDRFCAHVHANRPQGTTAPCHSTAL